MIPPQIPSRALAPAMLTSDERQWAMLAHLGGFAAYLFPFGNIIAPLIIWQTKKDTSAFVASQALESLNAQISFTIYIIVSIILCFLLIGILILPVVIITKIVCIILGAVAANEGRPYRYPFIFRLVS